MLRNAPPKWKQSILSVYKLLIKKSAVVRRECAVSSRIPIAPSCPLVHGARMVPSLLGFDAAHTARGVLSFFLWVMRGVLNSALRGVVLCCVSVGDGGETAKWLSLRTLLFFIYLQI